MNTELTNPDNKSVTTSKHNIDLKNTQITMAHRDSHPNNITGPFDLNKHNTIHPDVKLNSCNINVTQPNQSGGSEEHYAIDADGLTHSSNVSERTSIQPSNLKCAALYTDDEPYSCDICGKIFNYSDQFNSHKRTHTGDKPLSCDVCGKSFSESGSMKRHIRIHSGHKPYACKVCGKRFNASGNLNMHKIIHTGDKPFSCDICGKSFSRCGDMKRHSRIHSGDKPYPCNVCGKRFSESGNLNRHKRKHTGDKPFSCDVCGKSFSGSGTMKRHRKIHTGNERPYACDVDSSECVIRDSMILVI
ncbi:zinc finger protein 239-like [Leptidea sinapis]|uniref:zinc finger protein 239-like n=1 Tax=Leptidea sinapis TaxID=189913 RepID=UPI0021C3E295|nr:zinc finger protein 239-like [Leptidea sinapis]